MTNNIYSNTNSINNVTPSGGNRDQNISVTDMICEGPIRGLVDGSPASIFLDNVPAVDANFDGQTANSEGGLSPQYISGSIQFPSLGSPSLGRILTPGLSLPNLGFRLHILNLKNVYEAAPGTLTLSLGSEDSNRSTINITSAGLFTTGWSTDDLAFATANLVTAEGSFIKGDLAITDANTATFTVAGSISTSGINLTNSYGLRIEWRLLVSTNDNDDVGTTLAPPSGTYDFQIRPATIVDPIAQTYAGNRGFFANKTLGFEAQFRTGSLNQNPLAEKNGVGGSVVVPANISSDVDLRQLNPNSSAEAAPTPIDAFLTKYPDDSTESVYAAAPILLPGVGTFVSGGRVLGELDEISLTISYPGGLQLINLEKGNRQKAYAFYKIEINLEQGTDNWTGWRNAFPNYGDYIIHSDDTAAAIEFEHVLGLEQFRPFTDFQVRISRLTRDIGLPVGADGTNGSRVDKDKWQLLAASRLVRGQGFFNDKFKYPFTAVSSVSFSSQRYDNVPQRSYLLEGMKVRIPTTYTPREYSTTGEAIYANQFWDGSLTSELYYTDNPAWVFLDLVTNNRYGAGEWISTDDIDIYSLYRIAKYCDELVDDGKGGQEPRFRANLFLSKATDVYKVLKDMASIFTGMLYWMDGKLTAVADMPQDPVYTFTKGNVIGGAFNYESSGGKTRVNQVVVSWNDPESNYEPAPLIVEDREAIMRSGRIISQDSVAFGSTSEGQAIRYGRWKLWTAQNQTEVVSFSTALQGAYLKPGDVINVQDADRYGTAYSGRVKSFTTANPTETNTNEIVFDRPVAFAEGTEYVLQLLIQEPTAYYVGLNDLSTTDADSDINAVQGQRLAQAYVPGQGLVNLDSEERATNAFADSAYTNPISVDWKDYTHVQEFGFPNPETTTDRIENWFNVFVDNYPDGYFDNTVWALRVTKDDLNVLGSKKEYRILSVSQQSAMEYAISAVEYFPQKYDAVFKDYALGVIPGGVFDDKEPEVIPAPTRVYVELNTDPSENGEEVTLRWTPPKEIITVDSSPVEVDFRFISGYEIIHNVPGVQSPLRLDNTTAYNFRGLLDDTYFFSVRTIATSGNVSPLSQRVKFESVDPFNQNVPRAQLGIPDGMVANCTAFVSGDNTQIEFEKEIYTRSSVADVIDAATSTEKLSIGHLTVETPNIEYALLLSSESGIIGSGLSLAWFDTTSFNGLPFWRRMGATQECYDLDQNDNWFSTGNTVDIAQGTNVMTRVSGPGFATTTSLELRDVINLSGTEATLTPFGKLGAGFREGLGAKVIAIIDDDTAILDRPIPIALSATPLLRSEYRIDFVEDCIWGTLRRFSVASEAANFDFNKNIRVDSTLIGIGAVILDSNVSFLNYDSNDVIINPPGQIDVTATAIGFQSPVFSVTVPPGLNGSSDVGYQPGTGPLNATVLNVYDKTVDSNPAAIAYGDGSGLVVTVSVSEEGKEDVPEFTRQASFELTRTKEAASGQDARTVFLTSEDYTVLYNSNGTNPRFNDYSGAAGSITVTAQANLIADPIFEFKVFEEGVEISSLPWFDPGTTNIATFDFTPPATVPSNTSTVQIRVNVGEKPAGWVPGNPPADILATDTININYLQEGRDGLTVVLGNETHSMSTQNDGLFFAPGVQANSGTTIEVIEGATPLTYVDSGDPAPGEWTVGSTSTSDIAITVGAISGAGTTLATVADHDFGTGSDIENTETITYNILVGGPTDIPVTKKQTFSKAIAGAEGATGNSTALVYLYTNAPVSAPPSEPSADFSPITVDLTQGAIIGYEEGEEDWYTDPSQPPAAGSDVIWVVAATASGTGATDTIEPLEWSDPPTQFSGTDGFSSAVLELYQLTTTNAAPADPGALTYTFATQDLTEDTPGNFNDWSPNATDIDPINKYLWKITAGAASTSATDSINSGDWSDATLVAIYAEADEATNSVPLYLYKASAAQPDAPENVDGFPPITIDIDTASATYGQPIGYSPFEEWSFSPPTLAAGQSTWVVGASAIGSSGASTTTVDPGDWTDPPTRFSGEAGEQGFSAATIDLFQITPGAVAPASTPTGLFDYTFANGGLAGQTGSNLQGWILVTEQQIASLEQGEYLWKTSALAVSNGATYTIDDDDWSNPVVVGFAGTDSTVPGPTGLQSANFTIFFQAPSENEPSPPPTASTFRFSNFDFGDPSTLTPGWSLEAPDFNPSNNSNYWYASVTVIEDSADDGVATNDNIIISQSLRTIGFSGLVTFSGTELTWNDEGGEGLQTFNYTTINGATVNTGAIKSSNLNPAYVGSGLYTPALDGYTTSGSIFNLLNGEIFTQNFYVNAAGNVGVRGDLRFANNTQLTEDTVLNSNLTSANVTSTGALVPYLLSEDIFENGSAQTGLSANFTNEITSAGIFLTVENQDSYLNSNTTANDVGLGNVENEAPAGQIQQAFSASTSIIAGEIRLQASAGAGIADGNRVEISAVSNRIDIYDGGNLRVRIGKLT